MIAKKKIWIRKVNRLIDFMNYNWASDPKWNDYYEKTKTKKNSTIGGKKQIESEDKKGSKEEEEKMKRAYYST